MPRGLTTVGAALHGGALYLVGGYFGSPHEYSKEFQSGSVARLNLDTGVWEELAPVEPVQSPALVSDGRYLFKLGGLKALNAKTASTDMRSLVDNARFDATANRWEPVPSFPEPRSSHQAVIVGHTLYVVGGWQVHGGLNDNTWHSTMLTADLSQPAIEWKSHPTPFQVRAQGAAVHAGKLYLLGGLDPDGSTDKVRRYDLKTGQWSDGPDLPHDNMTTRAAEWRGELYANGADGNVYRLSRDETKWEMAGSVKFPRMFHEMVASDRGLLVLGGIPENGRGARVRLIEHVSAEPAGAGTVWSLSARSPAKNRQGAFLWSQQLFLFGGNNSLGQHDFAPTNFVSAAWRLDLGALEWRQLPDFPAARQSMQALVSGKDGSSALVLGGFGFAGGHLGTHADAVGHEIMKKEWAPAAGKSLPEGLSQFGLGVWKDSAWIFGGMNYDAGREKDDQIRHSRRVLKLDLSRPEAKFEDTGVALREPRRAFAGAVHGSSYFMFGGLKENFEMVTSCEAFELEAKQWRDAACPSQHRLGAELVALGEKLYLVGGSVAKEAGEREPTARIEVFDPAQDQWSALETLLPLDSADQVRAFAYQDQLLLYSAQRSDGRAQLALLDPDALARGDANFVRMNVPDPPELPR